MLGLIYLLLASFSGYSLLKIFLPDFAFLSKKEETLGNSLAHLQIPNWMIIFPSSFLIGTLLSTSFTYMVSYIFYPTGKPLLFGNAITLVTFFLFLILFRKKLSSSKIKFSLIKFKNFVKQYSLELSFLLGIIIFASFFMIYSFNIRNGKIFIGGTITGDFSLHLSTIRSFSYGLNFPTEYPLFPDGHMRYHFFFQFLAGNLEFLGLRLDWAYNIPSILAMVSVLMLLYSFAVILTKVRWVGIISCIFFIFRSSFAFLSFFKEKASSGIIQGILTNESFIGKTPSENCGIWTLNLYINQRHFLYSIGILIFCLMVFYLIIL